MGKRGPKPLAGVRENNGRMSRRVEHLHIRQDRPYAHWSVYLATTGGFTKIGFSGRVYARMQELSHGVGGNARIMAVIKQPTEADARALERKLHDDLITKGFQYEREWFDMGVEDVHSLVRRLREEGYEIVASTDRAGPEEYRRVRHKFSDANGRKFAY